MNEPVSKRTRPGFLKKHLFWDVNLEAIDLQAHKQFVIERILARGQQEDWAEMKRCYTSSEIREAAILSRNIDEKSRNFAAFLYDISPEEFKQCNSIPFP